MKELHTHPAADIFPEMNAQAFASLKADIAAQGQKERIKLYHGRILDGRHRYRACVELGIEPLTEDITGLVDDPVAYVLSLNLERRHLSTGQRAMVAARVANIKFGDFTGNQHTRGESKDQPHVS